MDTERQSVDEDGKGLRGATVIVEGTKSAAVVRMTEVT